MGLPTAAWYIEKRKPQGCGVGCLIALAVLCFVVAGVAVITLWTFVAVTSQIVGHEPITDTEVMQAYGGNGDPEPLR